MASNNVVYAICHLELSRAGAMVRKPTREAAHCS